MNRMGGKVLAQDDGFTLVESMVVVAILVILGTVAFASFGTWTKTSKVNGAANQLYSELNLARMKAISENNDYVVEFDTTDTTNHKYSIYDDDNNNYSLSGPESGELVQTINIGENFEDIVFDYIAGTKNTSNSAVLSTSPKNPVTFSDDDVVFLPTGLVSGGLGGTGTIYLMPSGETNPALQRAISVNLAGRIKLWTHNGTVWE